MRPAPRPPASPGIVIIAWPKRDVAAVPGAAGASASGLRTGSLEADLPLPELSEALLLHVLPGPPTLCLIGHRHYRMAEGAPME